MLDARARLVRSEEFALEETPGAGVYFRHRSGRRVETDALGGEIWRSLPGEAGRVVDAVRETRAASRGFLERYLFVLERAGIIRPERPEEARAAVERPAAAGDHLPREDLVSVIVVTHDGESHISECLGSVKAQTYRNLEVLVVDNASRDATARIVAEEFPEAKLFRLPKNRHFARAVNYGIAKAGGRYFLVLNQDLALEKDCLEALCRRARSGEKVAAVVPLLKFYHLRGFVNGLGNHVRNSGWGSDNFIGLVDVGQFRRLAEVPSACFGAVLLCKEAVADVGPLDGGFGSFYEDVDWSFRARLRGWRLVPAAGAVAYHKFGGSYLEDDKLRFIARNRLRLVLKVFQGRVLFGFLKRYVKEDIRIFLSLASRRKYSGLAAYVRAYVSLLAALPAVLVRRFRVLARKERGLREKDVLALNPGFFSGLNGSGDPVVNSSMIFGYYRWVIDQPE